MTVLRRIIPVLQLAIKSLIYMLYSNSEEISGFHLREEFVEHRNI